MVPLGTVVATNGASVNNTTTGTPFTIPPSWTYIVVITPTASGVTFRVRVSVGSGLAAGTTDYGVGEQTTVQFPCPRGFNVDTVVAIYGDGGGGNVRVLGNWGLAQS